MKKNIFALSMVTLLVVSSMTMLSGCTSKPKGLDKDVTGEVTVMTWGGSGNYYEDLGSQNLTSDQLTAEVDAAVYATAKAFKEIYPNVKINFYGKVGGPDDWSQERENFKAEHGKYPDIFATTSLTTDLSQGLVSDLSRFSDREIYQSFNKEIMNMMNYYGFQAGIPYYLIPTGVFVNKSLAEENNIDVPNFDWTIDEYTDFISQADGKTFFGDNNTNMHFISTGSKDLFYQLKDYKTGDEFINFNSDEVKDLLSYVPKWAKHTIWPQFDAGNLSQEVVESEGWWSWNFFIHNKLLTLGTDPWMMSDAAHPDENYWAAVQAEDWDVYPRPATEYLGNNVGIVVDPAAIYNHCMLDGNAECSEDENKQTDISFEFLSFWLGDTKAWEAKAEQTYYNEGTELPSLQFSFPIVTGKEFEKQKDILFSIDKFKRYADKEKMPGFQEVLRLYEEGQIWEVGDKVTPWFHDFEGWRRANIWEWDNIGSADVVGALRTDSNWLDLVISKLPDWNEDINARFKISYQELKDGLVKFYGYSEEDFK